MRSFFQGKRREHLGKSVCGGGGERRIATSIATKTSRGQERGAEKGPPYHQHSPSSPISSSVIVIHSASTSITQSYVTKT